MINLRNARSNHESTDWKKKHSGFNQETIMWKMQEKNNESVTWKFQE